MNLNIVLSNSSTERFVDQGDSARQGSVLRLGTRLCWYNRNLHTHNNTVHPGRYLCKANQLFFAISLHFVYLRCFNTNIKYTNISKQAHKPTLNCHEFNYCMYANMEECVIVTRRKYTCILK